jgi:predicted ArsR family transcriptional regulator
MKYTPEEMRAAIAEADAAKKAARTTNLVLAYLGTVESAKASDVAKALGMPEDRIRTSIIRLGKKGLVTSPSWGLWRLAK